ncbi:signal recognition particle-docking protein FtsY [Helcococcus ovis]|uniref:Signal recognition particle receptor FtsY n=1 Tax=Helcococcus ovis TaxID=72026 RepID=A0A4R9C3W5_9FIRM|nr:signal recognition particle-docking protein FtsY [Helcococcus ovis]TFF64885.1 signal recognition particle-docking protein FtsY [Helcococcus ovis]TFF67162.1 signal recognition particle-docking protein FtsY [Helcococcus ovis]
MFKKIFEKFKNKKEENIEVKKEIKSDIVEDKKIEQVENIIENSMRKVKELQENSELSTVEVNFSNKSEIIGENHIVEDVEPNKEVEKVEKAEVIEKTSILEEIKSEDMVVEAPIVEEIKEKPKKKGFLERLKSGLFKTRNAMNSAIDNLINGKAKIDDDLYDELEEIMISADMGVETTVNVIDELRDIVADNHIRDPKMIKVELEKILRNKLRENNKDNSLNIVDGKQTVILVIGVNGVGKTTTIGKLAYNLQKEGKTVILAAADTFRAAAIEQLKEWSERVNVELISSREGSDPASVVYDAIKSQKAKNKDVLIIDTAGRLHNKVNLMNELEKINRIISREHPEANRESLLVLDATTGQNALFQAKEFNKVTNITGLVLTKLDGTAKGGVVFPLQVENNVPVKYIGIGEKAENLEKFDSEKFVDALFDLK